MTTKTKERALTSMQFALYGQVEVSFNGGRGRIASIDFIQNRAFVEYADTNDEEWFSLELLRPVLRPMSNITDEEILKVCELADHTPFLTKKKWNIDRRRDDVIYISSKRSDFSFAIYTHKNTGYGDVTVTRQHEDNDPETEQTSRTGDIVQFYLDNKLDCFGWIDSSLALDKTKL
jgi:hypothetical protein